MKREAALLEIQRFKKMGLNPPESLLRDAGMQPQIQQTQQPQQEKKGGLLNWFTGGEKGIMGGVNTVLNTVSLPFYAASAGARGIKEAVMPSDEYKGMNVFERAAKGATDAIKRHYGPGDVIFEEAEGVVNPKLLSAMKLGTDIAIGTKIPDLTEMSETKRLMSGAKNAVTGIAENTVNKVMPKVKQGVGGVAKTITGEGSLADRIVLSGLGNNTYSREAIRKLKVAGITPYEFVNKYKLYGREPEAAKQAYEMALAKYVDEISKVNEKVPVKKILNEINDLQDSLQSGVIKSENIAKAMATLDEKKKRIIDDLILDNLLREAENNPEIAKKFFPVSKIDEMMGRVGPVKSEQSRKVLAELAKENPEAYAAMVKDALEQKIPLTSVNEWKRSIAKDIPSSAWAQNAVQAGVSRGIKDTSNIFKNILNEYTNDATRRIGAESNALKNFQKLFEKSQGASMGNKLVHGIKSVIPFMGYSMGNIPGAAAGFAFQRFLETPKGLEYAAKSAKTVEDLLKNSQLPLKNVIKFSSTIKSPFRYAKKIYSPLRKSNLMSPKTLFLYNRVRRRYPQL